MFTIRTKIDDTITLTTDSEFIFHLPGSAGFAEAVRIAKEEEITAEGGDGTCLDSICVKSPTYTDAEATDILDPGYCVAMLRNIAGGTSEALGVMVTQNPDDNGVLSLGETVYQFVYPGDSIFVMNDSGSTIESIK